LPPPPPPSLSPPNIITISLLPLLDNVRVGSDRDVGSSGGLDEGMPIEARYRGGKRYFKGTITRKRLNGTFDILYDDGEKEGPDVGLLQLCCVSFLSTKFVFVFRTFHFRLWQVYPLCRF
jgi:hypothetical protein